VLFNDSLELTEGAVNGSYVLGVVTTGPFPNSSGTDSLSLPGGGGDFRAGDSTDTPLVNAFAAREFDCTTADQTNQ
jgi:hypothetical protein